MKHDDVGELKYHLYEVELVRRWVVEHGGHILRRKTINRRITSYGLKHIAEKWAGEYISNDSLIQGLISCGFTAKRIPNTPNFFFNIPSEVYE